VHELLLQAFPFPSTLGEVTLHQLSQASVFIYSSRGKWVFPPLLWSFPPTAILQAFPLLVAGCVPPLLPSLAGLFIYSSMRDFPSPPLQCSGHPTLFATCLFFVVIVYYSVFFSFFPGWGLVCPGGYADLAQSYLWEYCMPLSSPCGLRLPKRSGHWAGALLVSPFNVKWECYAQAGNVEELEFCLFLVVFPVRCISSISPRFYIRKHAFCFLPLAAILESPLLILACVGYYWGGCRW
jgi:hypothetical protein